MQSDKIIRITAPAARQPEPVRRPRFVLLFLLKLYGRETLNLKSLIFLLAMFLLTAIAFTVMRKNDEGQPVLFQPVSLSVVDEDQSLLSYIILDQIKEISAVENLYMDTLDQALTRLDHNEILLIMVIPEGFYNQIQTGDIQGEILVYLNDRMPAESNIFARLLNQAAGGISSAQASLLAYQTGLTSLYDIDSEVYRQQSNAAAINLAFRLLRRQELVKMAVDSKFNSVWFVISALTCLFTLLPALIVLMLVQQERTSSQHERMLLAGVPWFQLHLAKIMIGLLWLAAGALPMLVLLIRLYPQIRILTLLAAIILLYMTAGFLCLALGYRSRQTESTLLTAWLGILGLLLAGGAIYPRQLLPDVLIRLLPLSPVYWCMNGIYANLNSRPVSVVGFMLAGLLAVVSAVVAWWSWRTAR